MKLKHFAYGYPLFIDANEQIKEKHSMTVFGKLTGSAEWMVVGALFVAPFLLFSLPAHALTLGFSGGGYADQLFAEVTESGSQVTFTFMNLVGLVETGGTLSQVDFNIGDAASWFDLSTGVVTGSTSGPLSAVNFSYVYAWNSGAGKIKFAQADADSPGPHNGLNEAADRISITFDWLSGKNLAGLVTAINTAGTDGLSLFQEHITNRTPSLKFTNVVIIPDGPPPLVPPVPEPATIGLVGMGLVALVMRRRSAL